MQNVVGASETTSGQILGALVLVAQDQRICARLAEEQQQVGRRVDRGAPETTVAAVRLLPLR
jgi:uncharacterized protein (DUF2252 family)